MSLCDFFVKDKMTGRVHRVGDDPHDSIWVDVNGELHYFHLQTGDGCSGQSRGKDADICGYEFVPSENGHISEVFDDNQH